ncbi:MAG TPA: D-alanyl-D-alanine carboxypeptidase [Acidothermaceae bacterium]
MRSLPRRVMARVSVVATTALVVSATGLAAQGTSDAASVVGGGSLAAQGTVVNRSAAVPALPPTTATAFIVADATTGQVLAARDAHGRLAPASTLKILTAVTMLPRLNPASVVKGSVSAATTDGTQVGVIAGARYRVSDLFAAMLVMSGNDAAVSIADAGGGLKTTLNRMNAEALHLRATDTVARTPNGLDAPGQTSSAYDLALIFRAGLAMPSFRHYLSLRSAIFPLGNGQSYRIYSHDRLLTTYPGMIGGKNGYTIAASGSFVGAATRGKHTIIVAVMRDRPNFWPEVQSLLTWGFAADGHVAPVGYLVAPRK